MIYSRGVLARYETEQDEPPGCDTCVKEPRSTNYTAGEAAWNLRSEVSALMFHHMLFIRLASIVVMVLIRSASRITLLFLSPR